MKLSTSFLFAAVAASALSTGHAFAVKPPASHYFAARTRPTTTASLYMAADTVYEGKPTERALNLDIREEVRKSSFFDVEGNFVTMDELIGEPSKSGVSVVVFLRSLG